MSWLLIYGVLPFVFSNGCEIATWENKTVKSASSLGSSLGRLGYVYGGKDGVQSCAKACIDFRFCYFAAWSKVGKSETCELLYYHFPPHYFYEMQSPLLVGDMTGEQDKSALIFNVTGCNKQDTLFRQPCGFRTVQAFGPSVLPVGKAPIDVTRALDVHDCAFQCGQNGMGCTFAVFRPQVVKAHSIEIHGTCYHYDEESSAMARGKELFDSESEYKPVLIKDIFCAAASVHSCTYEESTFMYKGLSGRPDLYRAARSAKECAFTCGHLETCISAVWLPPKLECMLYNSRIVNGAKFAVRSGRYAEAVHLVKIKCEGSDRPSVFWDFEPVGTINKNTFWKRRTTTPKPTPKPKPATTKRVVTEKTTKKPEEPADPVLDVFKGLLTGRGASVNTGNAAAANPGPFGN